MPYITLVDVILNRQQTDKLLVIKDQNLNALSVAAAGAAPPPTGRAA